MVVGTLDFPGRTADLLPSSLRTAPGLHSLLAPRSCFASGMPWRYEGVVHEYAVCDEPMTDARLEGEYYIESSRRLGGRNLDPPTHARHRDSARWPRSPATPVTRARSSTWPRATSTRATTRTRWEWYRKRTEMGGWEEEVYYALFRCGESACSVGCAPGPRSPTPTCARGNTARPGPSRCLHRLSVPSRRALPAGLPVLQARRRNPVSRTRQSVCPHG